MLKFFKTVLMIFVALFAIIVVAMLVIGKKYHFEKSIVVNAPIDVVYSHVSSSQKFNEWNPWMDLDKNLKLEYKGTQGTIGDEYCWEGNKDVGKGCHIITGLVPNQKVSTKMIFKEPFDSDATSDVVLTPEGSGTKVTWSMDCELDYPMNIMKLVMDSQMDKSYGGGLEKLKKLIEK